MHCGIGLECSDLMDTIVETEVKLGRMGEDRPGKELSAEESNSGNFVPVAIPEELPKGAQSCVLCTCSHVQSLLLGRGNLSRHYYCSSLHSEILHMIEQMGMPILDSSQSKLY